MSADASAMLRVLAFGSVDGAVWAAAVDGGAPALVWGDGAGTTASAMLGDGGWTANGRDWRLTGEGVDLLVEADGSEPEPGEAPGPVSGLQELCRVRGTLRLGGAERAVDCRGARSLLEGVDPARLDSVRAVSGWVDGGEAFTLLSLRAARGEGQESDLVAATLFDPDAWLPVADPRLSTTYDADGRPARTTLELWIGDGDQEYPRRAAGEAAGEGAAIAVGDGELRVVPLRCHSRGHEGAGAYCLLRF